MQLMIIKALGIFDIILAVLFLIMNVFNLGSLTGIVFLLGLFLLAKGLAFSTRLDIASVLDIITAVLVIIGTSLELPFFIVFIVFIYLLQKGIFSIL